jgi:hypothetical protein
MGEVGRVNVEVASPSVARYHRIVRIMYLMIAGVLFMAGCNAPGRARTYPEGTLPVRFEPATTHSTCLVASVAMAANYLFDQRRYTERDLLAKLKKAGKDETLTGDIKDYLETQGLYLITLVGQIDGKPPEALSYWLNKRGYPVICIINRHAGEPAFNHAVVVIGISQKTPADPADMIHYLDPSTQQELHLATAAEFETLWSAGGHAMMLVVAPPPESQPESEPRP